MRSTSRSPGLWRSIRNRQPGRPLWQIAAWYVMHAICFVVCLPLYRYRTWGVRHIPHTGPVLYVANHESFLDAVAIGLGTHRRHYFVMARQTLMGNAFLRFMAVLLNAVPVQRGRGDIGGIRQCIDVLNDGQALLVYPEGTRTPDGQDAKLQDRRVSHHPQGPPDGRAHLHRRGLRPLAPPPVAARSCTAASARSTPRPSPPTTS